MTETAGRPAGRGYREPSAGTWLSVTPAALQYSAVGHHTSNTSTVARRWLSVDYTRHTRSSHHPGCRDPYLLCLVSSTTAYAIRQISLSGGICYSLCIPYWCLRSHTALISNFYGHLITRCPRFRVSSRVKGRQRPDKIRFYRWQSPDFVWTQRSVDQPNGPASGVAEPSSGMPRRVRGRSPTTSRAASTVFTNGTSTAISSRSNTETNSE